MPRLRIARLNSDGSLDTGFQNGMSGANSTVYALALQPDGRVLTGGNFTFVNNSVRRRIARLETDGSTDTTFANAPAGPDDDVQAMALQSDGKLIVGGLFTNLNAARQRIARLNSDGSLDTGFLNGLAGANNAVNAVAVQADGKVLLGGIFSSVNNTTRTRLARLNADGSLDLAFAPTANATVQALAVQADGKILVGGQFSQINSVNRGRLARLNSNGTLDTAFLPGGIAGPDFQVESVVVQPDGQILVAGNSPPSAAARVRIARRQPDPTLNGMAGSTAPSSPWRCNLTAEYLIGAVSFCSEGRSTAAIARLNADGSLDTASNGMLGASATIQLPSPDGKVAVGGAFQQVNGVSRNHIARLTDGSLDTGFQMV
jgi:uncharacterized delta-60 repeat protein